MKESYVSFSRKPRVKADINLFIYLQRENSYFWINKNMKQSTSVFVSNVNEALRLIFKKFQKLNIYSSYALRV